MKTTKEKPLRSAICHFSVTGEGITQLIRDSWVSDIPKHALKICRESLGMTTEQALEVITGKKKLTGDTRIDDGLGWEDDDTTEESGIKLSVEVMVNRLENKFVDISESINIFNGINEDIEEDDFESSTKTLNGYKDKLADVLDQLQELYSITGKTLRDLPVERIRSNHEIKRDYKAEHLEEFSYESNEADSIQDYQVSILNYLETGLNNFKKDKEDVLSTVGGNKFYIVHTSIEKCKKEGLHSGWLLPDGTFFGGRSMWIHRGILDELSSCGFFKDKEYSSDEDDVQEKGGWIKVSNSDWMIWEHKSKPTNEQVEFIINYTIEVTESNFISNGFNKIHVQVFSEMLNGRTFDSYEMADESKGMEELKKEDNFPTVKEVSGMDVMCTPFFVPDSEFVKWLIKYANGRVIIDCGSGSGYLCALINKHGGKVHGLEPYWNIKRKMFWVKKGFMFGVLPQEAETSMFIDLPPERCLFVFARPCHSGFVERTIKKLKIGAEALYISHGKENIINDLGNIPYTKLNHEGTSKDNEYVLSIIK